MTTDISGSTGITFPDSSEQSTAAQGINVQTFTSSGTWTKPSGYADGSRVYVQVEGAGGSGGATGAAGSSLSGGGGGSSSGNSDAGGDGQVIITVFPA